MLVLTRKISEEIVITSGADQIILQVVGIENNKVRLGFVAPHQVKINRREVQDRGQPPPRLPERSSERRKGVAVK